MSRFRSVGLVALMFAALTSTAVAVWPGSAHATYMTVCNPGMPTCQCYSQYSCTQGAGGNQGVCGVISF